MRRILVFGVLLALTGCGGVPSTGSRPTEASLIECAPFAREVSGIRLYGDAADWWEAAEGRYNRSHQPPEGGVLVFRRSGRLPAGHVSVVARQVSGREIRVTQANWVHHMITRDELVVDVSPANDWSLVRVWWAPVRALGVTAYATYGFIEPGHAPSYGDRVAGAEVP